MVDYIIVPTSNCDYQEWQCNFLAWSKYNVKQDGQLVFLISKDTPNRKFPEYEGSVCYDLPDWAKEWEDENDDWYGGIPNKYNGIKWFLENHPNLKDHETILFLDPDMIFLHKVDLEVEDGEIVGQNWEKGFSSEFAKNTFSRFLNKSRSYLNNHAFMCPYAIRVSTLKRILSLYCIYSELLRRSTGEWIGEMFALYFAAIEHNITIKVKDNLGHCTAWWDEKPKEKLPQIIHYPNEIKSTKGDTLFFKQKYTFKQNEPLNITPSDIPNRLAKSLINNLFYFRDSDFNKGLDQPPTLTGPKTKGVKVKLSEIVDKYIVFEPWPGGFNNIRMSLEIATCIAYLTKRTLVLPPKYKMYLIKNEHSLTDFFDLDLVNIDFIDFRDFCKEYGFSEDYNAIEKHTSTFTFGEGYREKVFNFEKVKVPSFFHKGRDIINLHSIEGLFEKPVWFFRKNLLGSFYQVLHTRKMNDLKRLVESVKYHSTFYEHTENLTKHLPSGYCSLHIRRNDFQYKDTFIDANKIYDNIRDIIKPGSSIYISTDHTDLQDFKVLDEHYDVYYLKDLLEKKDCQKYKELEDCELAIIEQLICSNSQVFIGSSYSTFSSYVYRLRAQREDCKDKNYYTVTEGFVKDAQITFYEDYKYIASWYREYKDVAVQPLKSIFVSIASYCDRDLINTIRNLYKKASNPERVFVGVHIQDELEQYTDFLDNIKEYPNIIVKYTPKDQSKGVVWARNCIKDELFQKEDYYLQIDAHTRFKQDWDEILLNQYESIEHTKVILTTYPNEFFLSEKNEEYFRNPNNTALVIDRFIDSVKLKAKNTPPLEDYDIQKTYWVTAGFLFTKSSWIEEVNLPSTLIYGGEEDLQTHISFLQGWNPYITSEAVIWHNYGNDPVIERDRNRHVQDNGLGENIVSSFLNSASNFPRSVQELENYLGISFKSKDKHSTDRTREVHCFVWCIGDSPDSSQYTELKETAKKNGIQLSFLGVDSKYDGNTKIRFEILEKKLESLNNGDIVICTDGHDVLYVADTQKIIQKYEEYNTEILISAEKLFTYQWDTWKDKFDSISTNYKYVNAGTYMGKVGSLKKMLRELQESESWNDTELDQGLLGRWVYENFENKELVQLDIYTRVFWVTSGDWSRLEDYLKDSKMELYNEETNTHPCIIHNVGNKTYKDVYELVYKSIIER